MPAPPAGEAKASFQRTVASNDFSPPTARTDIASLLRAAAGIVAGIQGTVYLAIEGLRVRWWR